MSERSASPSVAPRRLSLGGILTGLAALGLAILYVRLPYMSSTWPRYYHGLFYLLLTGMSLSTLLSFGWVKIPEAWLQRVPSFGANRVYIPREGVGYLLIMCVLFIGSSLTQYNTLMLVFAAMAGPFVVNGSLAYTMLKNARVKRRTPPRAMAGELFSVEVELENATPWLSLWMMVVQDQIAYREETSYPSILFTRVAPATAQLGHYQVRLLQRGRHRFGPINISSRFPLGLVERGCLLQAAGEMLIYPRIGRLSSHWKRKLLGASELVETSQPRAGMFDDEFHHLREYRAGDNPRAIHWRSSARRNMLIVRDFQQNREHHLAVLIDLWPATSNPGGPPLIEQVLTLVATLCCEHRRSCRGATLTVMGCGRDVFRWEMQAHDSGLESLLDQLALIEPAQSDRCAATLNELLQGASSSTRVVVVSTRLQTDVPPTNRVETSGQFVESRRQRAAVQWLAVTADIFSDLVWFPDDDLGRPAPTGRVRELASTASEGVAR